MLDPDKSHDRVLMLQRLRDLTAERIELEGANQLRMWKLLEEKQQATIERLIACKMPDMPRWT